MKIAFGYFEFIEAAIKNGDRVFICTTRDMPPVKIPIKASDKKILASLIKAANAYIRTERRRAGVRFARGTKNR